MGIHQKRYYEYKIKPTSTVIEHFSHKRALSAFQRGSEFLTFAKLFCLFSDHSVENVQLSEEIILIIFESFLFV